MRKHMTLFVAALVLIASAPVAYVAASGSETPQAEVKVETQAEIDARNWHRWMAAAVEYEAEQARIRERNWNRWMAAAVEYEARQFERWINYHRWMAEATRRKQEAARLAAERNDPPYVAGIEVCNGRDLPPCHVVHRESRFNPNARNPRSSAWGLYQFIRGTWNSTCPEYTHGSASVSQQVECARRLWNGGRGASHWSQTL